MNPVHFLGFDSRVYYCRRCPAPESYAVQSVSMIYHRYRVFNTKSSWAPAFRTNWKFLAQCCARYFCKNYARIEKRIRGGRGSRSSTEGRSAKPPSLSRSLVKVDAKRLHDLHLIFRALVDRSISRCLNWALRRRWISLSLVRKACASRNCWRTQARDGRRPHVCRTVCASRNVTGTGARLLVGCRRTVMSSGALSPSSSGASSLSAPVTV